MRFDHDVAIDSVFANVLDGLTLRSVNSGKNTKFNFVS
jgi:hypothetical protein